MVLSPWSEKDESRIENPELQDRGRRSRVEESIVEGNGSMDEGHGSKYEGRQVEKDEPLDDEDDDEGEEGEGDDCLICHERMRDGEAALVENCDHIVCGSCFESMNDYGTFRYVCPVCRTVSGRMVFSRRILRGRQRTEAIDLQDDRCRFDPVLRYFAKHCDDRWSRLAACLLGVGPRARPHAETELLRHGRRTGAELVTRAPRYAVFVGGGERGREDEVSALAYGSLPSAGVSVELLTTTERLRSTESDESTADAVADWLLRLLLLRTEEVASGGVGGGGGDFRGTEGDFCLVWRRFGRNGPVPEIHCLLLVEFEGPESSAAAGGVDTAGRAPVSFPLDVSLLRHNLKRDVTAEALSGMKRNLFPQRRNT